MRRHLIIAILLSCGLTLWAQQRYFQVEVLQPAKISLPAGSEHIRSVLLVNNTVVQPANFGHSNKLNDEVIGQDSVILTDAAKMVLFGAEAQLTDAHVWEDVSMLDRTQNRGNNFYRRSPLTYQRADSLCEQYGVDALLCLNHLVIYDVQEMFLTEDDNWYAYIEGYCSAQWSLHQYGKRNAHNFSTADTLRWADEQSSPTAAFERLPLRQNALLELAQYSGEQLGIGLTPQPTTEDRFIYQNKQADILAGIEALRHRRWSEAISHWQAATTASDRTTRAYAWANIAVAQELQGKISEAKSSIDKAISAFRELKNAEAIQQVVNLTTYKNQLK